MTWEEIIRKIRTQPEYKELVEQAYFDEDLALNVERFRNSEEYRETKKIITKYAGQQLRILDIGSGNGISSVAFALDGWKVVSCEPDPSNTVGSGAIRWLKDHYKLSDLEVVDAWGEQLPFGDGSFDIVYIRQAMHHAANLDKFVAEASRVLKKNGLFLTIRDHVIFDEADKKWFLEMHPLHKFYGGENAFTEAEYSAAMTKAGLEIKHVLRYFDSSINYFPGNFDELQKKIEERNKLTSSLLRKRLGIFSRVPVIRNSYHRYITRKLGDLTDERSVPGRMYTFICLKK
jgi:ubiquinone/menaquinone biosynthesis C-methylase UbiE